MTADADERMKRKVGTRNSSVWAMGGLTWKELIRRIWRSSNDDDIFNRGYELAYNFLIAVFPFLLFLMALFGLSVSEGAKLQSGMFHYFQEMLPPSAYDLLQQTINEVIQRSNGRKLTFGLLLALYAGSSGTTQLMFTLNAAYKVRETRSWIKVRLISLALTLVISMLVILASLLVLGGGFVAELLGREVGLSTLVVAAWKAVQLTIAIGFVLLACAIIYYVGPDLRSRQWHWITPGSVLGVTLWLSASAALRLYLHSFASYSASYGSVGAVIILLLWFYLTGLSFLIGAELNSVAEQTAGYHSQDHEDSEAA